MFPKISAILLLSALVPAAAQEPLNRPAPFAAQPGPPASQRTVPLMNAQFAHEFGLPSFAAEQYRLALDAFEGSDAERAQLSLKCASAQLDAGDVEGAERTLNAIPQKDRDSGWNLRGGLVAAHQKRTDEAKRQLGLIKPAELSAVDLPWHFFLQGMLANSDNDSAKALAFYRQAEFSATSEPARAQFHVRQIEAQLKMGAVRDTDLEAKSKELATKAGAGLATSDEYYLDVQTYALMLDASRRKPDAIAQLRRLRDSLSAKDAAWIDSTNLLLGIIAGASEAEGRAALVMLLTSGASSDVQRIALVALAGASRDSRSRIAFRGELDKLIARTPPHRIVGELLLYRAVLQLAERNYPEAESDADAMLQRFPASQLKPQALAILASAAWEQYRYIRAADYAIKASDGLPAGQARFQLGLLAAEAYFRAKEFRRSADAYEAVLRELPEGALKSRLMFQRVQAELEAISPAQPEQAAGRVIEIMDALSKNPAFDAEDRWQAEWNLAQRLKVLGLKDRAFARLNGLLDAPAAAGPAIPASLLWLMKWLQADLSLAADKPEQTLRLATALETAKADGVPADLMAGIRSKAVLLRARAELGLGREPAALATFKRLREQFPKSPDVVNSYLVEAAYTQEKGQTVDAQNLLRQLADNFPESPSAPLALYRAALLDQTLGHLDLANNNLDKVVTTFPKSELVPYIRYKQGEILQLLGRYPQAVDTFSAIINDFPSVSDMNPAQFALYTDVSLAQADAQAAQAEGDPNRTESAARIYERLRTLPTLPVDKRVESGFKLGNIRRNIDWKQAREDWMSLVTEFLVLDANKTAPTGANYRFWMEQTLRNLGDLMEAHGQRGEAITYWTMIRDSGLPAAEANKRLKLSSSGE